MGERRVRFVTPNNGECGIIIEYNKANGGKFYYKFGISRTCYEW